MSERLNKIGRAEPRFDIDVVKGRQGELQIDEFLEWIAKGNGEVEVKVKRTVDLSFYVETECDKGRKGVYEPSGINVTTAKAWAFCVDDLGLALLFPTDLLRHMLDDASTRDVETTRGSCPTRGKLLNLAACLYVEKRKREAIAQAQVSLAKPALPTVTATNRVARDLLVDEIKW